MRRGVDRFTNFVLFLIFNQVYRPYRALKLWQTMVHGLEASSYSTVSCPYETLGRDPLSIIFLVLFLAPNRLYAQGF